MVAVRTDGDFPRPHRRSTWEGIVAACYSARLQARAMERRCQSGILIAGLAAMVTASGCFRPTEYHSQHVDRARAATVLARFGTVRGRSVNAAREPRMDIYGYDQGCPNISFRMTSSGYKGTVPIHMLTDEIIVPAGQRIVLKSGWLRDYGTLKSSCTSVLTFRPDAGPTYIYEYAEPSEEACASNVGRVVSPAAPGAPPQIAPIDSLVKVQTEMGLWGYTADDLCNLTP